MRVQHQTDTDDQHYKMSTRHLPAKYSEWDKFKGQKIRTEEHEEYKAHQAKEAAAHERYKAVIGDRALHQLTRSELEACKSYLKEAVDESNE